MISYELAHFLRRDGRTRRCFQGVYPIDRLPSDVRFPCALVINTDVAARPGKHWLAIYIDCFRRGVFFDSYGFEPRHPALIDFLQRHTVYWRFNDIQIQSLLSKKCGLFCLYFLYQQARGLTLQATLKPFDRLRLEKNDRYIVNWYCRQSRSDCV